MLVHKYYCNVRIVMPDKRQKVIVIGCGHMGSSHARSYKSNESFELVGLVDLYPTAREKLAEELGGVAQFDSLDEAIKTTNPDAAAIATYPDTHADLTEKCLKANLHVFVEKPMAETVECSQGLADLAKKLNRKLLVGYILRHHPAWQKFIEIAHTLGKPLVMRMNLNQQSSAAEWQTHKKLLVSMSPIVDCGIHYIDVMCQMTRSKPISVSAIGARLTEEIAPDMYNYGQLQVRFEDGSVGWYEAGWGPMISEVAYFVKDVIGPKGCVSIGLPAGSGDSADIEGHTKVNSLLKHNSALDPEGNFAQNDEIIDTRHDPGHQQLCDLEQAYFLKAIKEDIDLTEHHNDAINSLRIALAADESVRVGKVIEL